MKLKQLLLAFVAFFGLVAYASAQTDIITYSTVSSVSTDSKGYYLKDIYGTANYTVYAAEENGHLLLSDWYADIVTTTSAGRVKTVTVDWAGDNTEGLSTILIYSKSSAYANTGAEWDDMGDLVASITYPATSVTLKGDNRFVMIVGESDPRINGISLTWENITTHKVNLGSHANGTITVSPEEAETGATVKATFTGGRSGRDVYELRSYEIDGKSTNLTPSEYTSAAKTVSFKMPDHDIYVSAVFSPAPIRTKNNVTVNDNSQVSGKTITIVSGSSYNFTFTADYALVGSGSHDPYTEGVTLKETDKSMAVCSGATYNPATGTGSFRLTAYNQGTSKLQFSTIQTNDYNATTVEYTIVVVPREIMLITEYNGSAIAVVNSLDLAGKLAAQELLNINGETYIPGGTAHTKAQMTWNVCTKADGTYTIQNAEGKYLGYSPMMPNTITLEDKEYVWYKYSDAGKARFFNNNNEIVYYSTRNWFANYAFDMCDNNSDYSHGAYEVLLSNVKDLAEALLPRNLVQDQFNTVCMDKAFICPNANVHFYSLTCMEDKGGKFNFSFEEHDFTATPSEAGTPYIVKATDGNHNKNLHIYTIGESVSEYKNVNGLIGMKEATVVSELPDYTDAEGMLNILVFYDGNLTFAKSGKVGANSAYIQFQNIPNCDEVVSSPARRVVLEVEKQDAPAIATGVENLSADQINWNEPVYNIMGQRVARGTTGVLVQNGQKFIAQ